MTLRPPWSDLARSPELWLRQDERALQPDADLERARTLLDSYAPPTADQAALRQRMLDFLAEHPSDAHRRECRPGHLTASALLVDAALERALFLHHKKLGRWLQPGGHCDGDANLAGVALREAREESGIEGLLVLPGPIDLDIHAIPARPDEPRHLHLDVRFLILAPASAQARPSAESHALTWLEPARARALAVDDSIQRLLRRCFG